MLIKEIFLSLQGESTHAGLPCTFIRLAGCNLDCHWCDTPGARASSDGSELSIEEITAKVKELDCSLVEITGGEPLLQDGVNELISSLLKAGRKVILETNGTVSLAGIDRRVIKIVDVKCPSSGHGGSFELKNLDHLTPADEIKFVIADKNDYEYAKEFIN
ncbi:MAG: radical SAM protein, partial [Thermodesulfobacteriota bacterium]